MRIKKSKLNEIITEEIINFKKSYLVDEELLKDVGIFFQQQKQDKKILKEANEVIDETKVNNFLNLYIKYKIDELTEKLKKPEQLEAVKYMIEEINKN